MSSLRGRGDGASRAGRLGGAYWGAGSGNDQGYESSAVGYAVRIDAITVVPALADEIRTRALSLGS